MLARLDRFDDSVSARILRNEEKVDDLQVSDKKWAGITGLVSVSVSAVVGWLMPHR